MEIYSSDDWTDEQLANIANAPHKSMVNFYPINTPNDPLYPIMTSDEYPLAPKGIS